MEGRFVPRVASGPDPAEPESLEAETEDRPGRLRRVSFVLEAPPEDPSDLAEGARNAQPASPDQLSVFLPDEDEIILPGLPFCPFRLGAAEKAAG